MGKKIKLAEKGSKRKKNCLNVALQPVENPTSCNIFITVIVYLSNQAAMDMR